MKSRRIVLFANTDWYLFNFRLSLAKRLRADGHKLLLISPSGPYGTRLVELGFRWQPVRMNRRSLAPAAEGRLLIELANLFRRERPDLVHDLTIKCAVYGSIAARLAGVPARVSAVNGLGWVFTNADLRARVLRPIVRSVMRQAFLGDRARLIVQNPDDRAMFVDAGLVHPDYIRLIPGSGVDCRRFVPSSRPRAEHDPVRVLLPARLLYDKGVREFVDAARRLKGTNIVFSIAGEADLGNPAAVSPDDVRTWKQEGVVELLGHVECMEALFSSVDIVALPSYREGLPKSLIEGAACALPLVATDVPGCRDVVTDGVTGLLVPARDATALANAIARLAGDASLRTRLGRAARARALEKYDEEIIVDQTLSVYDEII